MRRRAQQAQGEEQHSEREREGRGSRRSDPIFPPCQQPAVSEEVVPVFVFPRELSFYADDQTNHKQVLTLYNPFNYPLKFKVLSTAPSKYTVIDAEGCVKRQSCIDIVIRHKDISARHYGVPDKFRIEVSEEGSKKVLGLKTISSVLHPTKREQSPADKRRKGVSAGERSSWSPTPIAPVQRGYSSPPLFLMLLAGLLCITVLMLPQQGETSTLVPVHLHVTIIQKLVAAYVLGLLTMVFLQG